MSTPEPENVNVPAQTVKKFSLHIKHIGIGPGKKELTFFEVVTMLQTRYDHASPGELAYPQKGLWIYERDAQMRRHYKRSYPEFFAPRSDRQAAQKRQEQHAKAERIEAERRARGAVFSERPQPIDISTYRKRASG